jgi:cyclopropane-fatty-acyl-phospholipid synthase
MLYKFKSKAAGDLIMLEPNGRQVLQIIGKDPGPKGIIEPAQMGAAIQALEAAIERDEAEQKQAESEAQAQAKGEKAARGEGISLRQRAVPLVDMLRRAQKDGEDIVWGV